MRLAVARAKPEVFIRSVTYSPAFFRVTSSMDTLSLAQPIKRLMVLSCCAFVWPACWTSASQRGYWSFSSVA